MLREGLQSLERLPRPLLLAIAFLMVGLTALISVQTRAEFRFSFFYLIPIALVSWFVGRRSGLLFAAASSAIWLGASLAESGGRDPSEPVVFWNGLLLLSFFLLVSLLLSALKAALAREKFLARSDPLTQLSNRRAFFERAEIEVHRAARFSRSLSVAYVDIDDFKAINDRYGHGAGDRVLRLVADSIRSLVRSIDLVARLGGDEFILLLTETGAEDAQAVIRKIHGELNEAARKEGWGVTFSIGCLTFQTGPDSVEEMVRMADAVMYSAKSGGKNRMEARVVTESPR